MARGMFQDLIGEGRGHETVLDRLGVVPGPDWGGGEGREGEMGREARPDGGLEVREAEGGKKAARATRHEQRHTYSQGHKA